MSKLELEKTLDTLIEHIIQSEERVANGILADLGQLDQQVMGVLRAIKELPEEEGMSFEPKVEAMVHQLEKLSGALQKFQSFLETQEKESKDS